MLLAKVNLATILIAVILCVFVALAIFVLVRDKKAGKTGCGGACEGCAMRGMCHEEKDQKE